MILRRPLPEEGSAEPLLPGEAGREQDPALGYRGEGVSWAEQHHQPSVSALCCWALPRGLSVVTQVCSLWLFLWALPGLYLPRTFHHLCPLSGPHKVEAQRVQASMKVDRKSVV